MAFLDTGFFFVLAGLAFGFMIYSIKINLVFAPIFRVLSIVLFFVMALYLLSGYGIQSETTYFDGTTTWTQTETMLDENAEGFWIGYFFVVLGFLNLFLMYLDFFKGGADG